MSFDRCVFVNCPFDRDYDAILQAILFVITYFGFEARIARERNDSGEHRLAKIAELIEKSRFSIHDLSRSRARKKGEYARHNMPFELGMDFGCRQFGQAHHAAKQILVLADKRYDYAIALSDLAGNDIQSHGGKFDRAIRCVRNWLVNDAQASRTTAPGRLIGKYADFSGWHYERQLAAGFTAEDIEEYPTKELLAAMVDWLALGEPGPAESVIQ